MSIILLFHRKEGYEVVYIDETWIHKSHNKPVEWNENKKGKYCCSHTPFLSKTLQTCSFAHMLLKRIMNGLI